MQAQATLPLHRQVSDSQVSSSGNLAIEKIARPTQLVDAAGPVKNFV